jgi:adenylosuccinate synthase
MNKIRKNSIALCGGAFGDEGKGRIVDEFVSMYAKKGPVVVYRDNGGANAGHTVELFNGTRIALHQLPSGVLCNKATVILGKGMVLHPGDLIEEIQNIEKTQGKRGMAKIKIDEMAVLSLDTHRAFESVLKAWMDGGKGATGRGISPAYADILLRHPLRMRDLLYWNESALIKHYELYASLIKGLGQSLEKVIVPSASPKGTLIVGSKAIFLKRLKEQQNCLIHLIQNVQEFMKSSWENKNIGFVFEKAQALGLDNRYGVYPDITASDTTFDGIFSSSESIIDPDTIEIRAAVIKATYMSSVGARILPTIMEHTLVTKIREDAHEYGATTKRPRGVFYLDLPIITYLSKVGRVNAFILTHMDIVYPDTKVKVCVAYEKNGKPTEYRPDQEHLLNIKPIYKDFVPWDKTAVQKAKTYKQLPKEAQTYLTFLSKKLNVPIMMITTGPKRSQGIRFS